MDRDELRQRIVTTLREQKERPLSAAEIAAELHLRGAVRKRLQKWLNELVVEGVVVCIRNNRYSLGKPADLVTGTLDIARSGNGYVKPADGETEDVFVSESDLSTAMPGDRVVVRLNPETPEGRRRVSGKVIEILERVRHDIVGTLKSTGKFLYVLPLDPSYRQDIYVPSDAGAKLEDRVVVRVTAWPNRHVSPEGEIVETLGPADDPSVDTLSVIRQFELREEFPAAVLHEAESVSALMDKPGPRLDLRGRFILTIDPERARDFDDALSLERDERGNRVLGVHIADVSHFVRPGKALDREARQRGNSVYLPDKVLPMLPEQLSNGVCSLKPDEDRLALSVFLTLDGSGGIMARRFAKTLIRSRLRLTYEQAMAMIEGGAGAVERGAGATARPGAGFSPRATAEAVDLLRQLNALARQLRQRRFAHHALDLDMPECEIVMGPDGRMQGFRIVVNDESHQLVEECMVAANEAVAQELLQRGIKVIARFHDKPSEDKIADLADEVARLGYHPGNLNQQRNLAAFLKKVEGDPLAHHVRMATLRSLMRAVYTSKATGHYGLAKKYYSHFTSPIRRYPDLVLHRQLAALLATPIGPELMPPGTPPLAGGQGGVYAAAELEAVAQNCTDTEQTADEAERTLLEIKKYRYLAQQIEDGAEPAFDAVVVSVTNFGMFVELIDLQLQGLVHISGLSDQFVRHDSSNQTLSAGPELYKVGRRLRVVPTGVDFDKRRIDFRLAEGGKQPESGAARAGRNRSRSGSRERSRRRRGRG